MGKKTILILGAGSRGSAYARCLLAHRERVEVVGVADTRADWRESIAAAHDIPPERQFADWREPLAAEKFADMAIVALPDHLHVEPALAYAGQGYHLLLEKPMAPAEEDCHRIVDAVRRAGVLFGVCHVLRYAPYTARLKEWIEDGRIGEPLSIQHLEPVGYWHMAHSYVRGNWRNTAESSFMLMAKSCHDLDWISFIIGGAPTRVSSFGRLSHFRPENAPDNAADRCLDCEAEPDCPYSAKKLYLGAARRGDFGWPTHILTSEPTVAGVERALREGPYGRCVYRCDNDVVDHQVVNMEFANGATGVFTMTAFTPMLHRQTRVFGTRGMIESDGDAITLHDFRDDTRTTHGGLSRAVDAHSGADTAMIERVVEALVHEDQSLLLTGPDETLASHIAVFAAERSRLTGQTVEVPRGRGKLD